MSKPCRPYKRSWECFLSSTNGYLKDAVTGNVETLPSGQARGKRWIIFKWSQDVNSDQNVATLPKVHGLGKRFTNGDWKEVLNEISKP
jgi:hypothetical protein